MVFFALIFVTGNVEPSVWLIFGDCMGWDGWSTQNLPVGGCLGQVSFAEMPNTGGFLRG